PRRSSRTTALEERDQKYHWPRMSVTLSIVPTSRDAASPAQNCHVPAAVFPMKVSRSPGGAAPLFGANEQIGSSLQSVWVSRSVLPISSALTAAPVWKLIGNATARLESVPQQSTPSSASSNKPGRLISVTTVLSGLTILIARSPIQVCDMATL